MRTLVAFACGNWARSETCGHVWCHDWQLLALFAAKHFRWQRRVHAVRAMIPLVVSWHNQHVLWLLLTWYIATALNQGRMERRSERRAAQGPKAQLYTAGLTNELVGPNAAVRYLSRARCGPHRPTRHRLQPLVCLSRLHIASFNAIPPASTTTALWNGQNDRHGAHFAGYHSQGSHTKHFWERPQPRTRGWSTLQRFQARLSAHHSLWRQRHRYAMITTSPTVRKEHPLPG